MPGPPASTRTAPGLVHLLDRNVLCTLIYEANVNHGPARRWSASLSGEFATGPTTQGTLVRMVCF